MTTPQRHEIVHTREHLDSKLSTVTLEVLRVLQSGPETGAQIAEQTHCSCPSKHIQFLREAGFAIEAQYLDSRNFLYMLLPGEMPAWDVDVAVTLADGSTSVQFMRVRAMTARHAKAKARMQAQFTKVVKAELLKPLTGHEMDTHWEGH